MGHVVVLGGGGFFGGEVVRDVLAFTDASVVVVGRRSPPVEAFGAAAVGRVRSVAADVFDADAMDRLADGAAAVAHCAGPYQRLPLAPARAAIRAGAAYVDLSDDRAFTRAVAELDGDARAAGAPLLSGLSSMPGLSAHFAATLARDLDEVDAVRGFIAIGSRGGRGEATFASGLSGVGRPIAVPRRGRIDRLRGWSEPELVRFPPPIGGRICHLATEVPDFDLFPAWFGAESVELRAGTDLPIGDLLLGLAGLVRSILGVPRLDRWLPALRAAMAVAGELGDERGGVLVEVTGRRGGRRRRRWRAVVAREGGHRIPAVLAGIALARAADGRLRGAGVLDLRSWIGEAELLAELARRGLTVFDREEGGRFRRVTARAG